MPATFNQEEMVNVVNQICEAWEMETPDIRFLEYEYMETTLGIVLCGKKEHKGNYLEKDLIVFNEILLHYPLNKILQVIYHELAHLITKAGDDHFSFQMFCKMNNIPLSEEWQEEE